MTSTIYGLAMLVAAIGILAAMIKYVVFEPRTMGDDYIQSEGFRRRKTINAITGVIYERYTNPGEISGSSERICKESDRKIQR